MIGTDKSRATWRVLKIDRLEPSELNIIEDTTTYSEVECCDLLRRIHEGNKPTGGLKFVTTCYGIIGMTNSCCSFFSFLNVCICLLLDLHPHSILLNLGFIKFLGPYYMLVITKRRKIGAICGHQIYAITKSEMIPIPHSSMQTNVAYSKNEKRSYVNSACKCNMSLVLRRRTFKIIHSLLVCI